MSLKEFGYMSVRLKVRGKKMNTFPSSPARSCIRFSALKCTSFGVSELPKHVCIALLERNMLSSAVLVSLSNTAIDFIELPAESSIWPTFLDKNYTGFMVFGFHPPALYIDL